MLLGRPLAPTYPVVGEALQGGKLGVEQARVIVKVLDELRPSVLVDDLDRVERSLVASGSGAITPETEGLPGAGIAFAPESLRLQGIAWQARLAPDGSAPGEAATEWRSWLAFGGLANGGYSLSGWLTTLDRAVISTVFDAYLSSAAANPVPGLRPVRKSRSVRRTPAPTAPRVTSPLVAARQATATQMTATPSTLTAAQASPKVEPSASRASRLSRAARPCSTAKPCRAPRANRPSRATATTTTHRPSRTAGATTMTSRRGARTATFTAPARHAQPVPAGIGRRPLHQ